MTDSWRRYYMSEITAREGVLRFHRPGTRWLSTGWQGGYRACPTAYNVSVPEQWEEVDLDAYAAARRERAGFDASGPTLFTGVDLQHARGARCDTVTTVVTAGVSNPAALPMEPTPKTTPDEADPKRRPGTVNIILTTTKALTDGALATLLACVVEAKSATLLSKTKFTGTTTDAVVVGCAQNGTRHTFAGSATAIGTAARACVREGICASLESRYADTTLPESVDDAQYGVTTSQQANVFEITS